MMRYYIECGIVCV